jgi:hypothetical protein
LQCVPKFVLFYPEFVFDRNSIRLAKVEKHTRFGCDISFAVEGLIRGVYGEKWLKTRKRPGEGGTRTLAKSIITWILRICNSKNLKKHGFHKKGEFSGDSAARKLPKILFFPRLGAGVRGCGTQSCLTL